LTFITVVASEFCEETPNYLTLQRTAKKARMTQSSRGLEANEQGLPCSMSHHCPKPGVFSWTPGFCTSLRLGHKPGFKYQRNPVYPLK